MGEKEDIEAFIAETLESAGVSGLCREGCLELAVDQLRRRHPEIDSASAWGLVRGVSDWIDKKIGEGE